MSKLKPILFTNDDSDHEIDFKTNNEYAKGYNTWRKKEEINKLKTKYGENLAESGDDDSSSSSDDDSIELDDELERDFFKTLSSLKNKDPKIYDGNVKFFKDEIIDTSPKKKKSKEEPMFLKDYERKLILEKGGQLSDSEDETDRPRSPTYVQQQRELKEKLKDALTTVEEDENEGWGGLFQARQKSKEEKEREDADYKQWLLGQKGKLDDESMETELKPLKDYWNNPKLDEGEKFLRDYVLNNKFLDKDDDNYVPTYEEVVHDSDAGLSEDEVAVDKQEEFEHKYNYRFEEPDQDFIKRYPRTMENSLRKTDDRRKVKRAEVKERKQKEKQEKMDELKKLKELKRQEIEEKLEKLREITGNSEVAFDGLDDDFDPDDHDKRMQAMFNEEFYEGEEGDQKPEFPDLDEELEIERFDKYNPEDASKENNDEEGYCEDEDFNMDCDYDPAATQNELIENSKGKKKRKRKSKFAKAISEPKPLFNPNDKTYEEYLDEYYKLDCEDIIGDIPCRFKYRKVLPNSFGLTVDEILRANDRELNRWCSLKKAIQIRPDHVEKYDQIAFSKKGQNEALKRKILPSLYAVENAGNNSDRNEAGPSGTNKKRNAENDDDSNEDKIEAENRGKGKKNNKRKAAEGDDDNENDGNLSGANDNKIETVTSSKSKKNNKKKSEKSNNETNDVISETQNDVEENKEEESTGKKKKKRRGKKNNVTNDSGKQVNNENKNENMIAEYTGDKKNTVVGNINNKKVSNEEVVEDLAEKKSIENTKDNEISETEVVNNSGNKKKRKRKGNKNKMNEVDQISTNNSTNKDDSNQIENKNQNNENIESKKQNNKDIESKSQNNESKSKNNENIKSKSQNNENIGQNNENTDSNSQNNENIGQNNENTDSNSQNNENVESKSQNNKNTESKIENNKNTTTNKQKTNKNHSNQVARNPNKKTNKNNKQNQENKGKKRKNSETFAKGKKFKPNKEENVGLSDARLQAFGIKPKKFKNKMKYGGQTKK